MNQNKTKHGFAGTRLYQCWVDIKHRCFNPKYRDYHCYGGRGINICNEWLSFIPFKEWALTHGYNCNLEIDRIDNNGNYEPNNCRWVTRQQNALNRQKREDWGIYKNGKFGWGCHITRNRKNIYIGTYRTIEEAIEGRNNYLKFNM